MSRAGGPTWASWLVFFLRSRVLQLSASMISSPWTPAAGWGWCGRSLAGCSKAKPRSAGVPQPLRPCRAWTCNLNFSPLPLMLLCRRGTEAALPCGSCSILLLQSQSKPGIAALASSAQRACARQATSHWERGKCVKPM